jgi:hypothetical protein
MDGLFSAKVKDFDNQQKERSESSSDEYKFQRKSCEDQYESSAKGFAVYSCTTLQPSSDESAILTNFWR